MNYRIGEIVEGVITGIQPYGAFVSLQNGSKGLIHISEISERFVKDVGNFVKMNERIQVKVLDFDEEGEHLKLSLKAVSTNKARFKRPLHHAMQALPKSIIGFASLADKLDGWIDSASK